MFLNFRAVKGGRSIQTFQVPVDGAFLEGFFGRLTRPIDVTAEIVDQPHRLFLVRIAVRDELEVPCRRCLTPVWQQIDERTTLLFQVMEPGDPRRLEGDDADVLPLRGLDDRVDIEPHVREALLLAAENFPVCRPDCRGICPTCGQELNAAACACVVQSVDPRWEKLQKLSS